MLPNHVLAVDFETTDATTWAYPISLTVAEIIDGKPTGCIFNTAIKAPGNAKVSLEALHVQGFSMESDPSEMVKALVRLFPKDGKGQEIAMQELANWSNENSLRGLPCIAHHMPFDIHFYSNSFCRHHDYYNGSPLGPIWICTKQLAESVWDTPMDRRVGFSLDKCLARLNLPRRKDVRNHDATEDALLCARVYEELRKLFNEKFAH